MMPSDYCLVDIPSSLSPTSFKRLNPRSSKPPDQPRNLPEPKHKDVELPQAGDLKTIHRRYGGLVDKALQSAKDDGVLKWCQDRIEWVGEDNEAPDLRQWEETFKIMKSFAGHDTDRSVIYLTNSGIRNKFLADWKQMNMGWRESTAKLFQILWTRWWF